MIFIDTSRFDIRRSLAGYLFIFSIPSILHARESSGDRKKTLTLTTTLKPLAVLVLFGAKGLGQHEVEDLVCAKQEILTVCCCLNVLGDLPEVGGHWKTHITFYSLFWQIMSNGGSTNTTQQKTCVGDAVLAYYDAPASCDIMACTRYTNIDIFVW